MAANPKRRQRKLEQKTARRKAKRTVAVKQSAGGFAERVLAAAHHPPMGCYITDGLEDEGMASVLLARQLSDGQVAFSMFLVDTYCLGVKDSSARIVSRSEYSELFDDWIADQAEAFAPADARKLVEEAAEWGRRIGFPPRGDYRKACAIFHGIDVKDSTRQYQFGKNGKPFYINGPDETPQDIERIRQTLELNCGARGYETLYLVK